MAMDYYKVLGVERTATVDAMKAAYRKLVGWIDHYPGLAVRLAELGKLPGSRSYTPAQVREIVEALGEP